MAKTRGRVFDTPESWTRRLSRGGADSATSRNIRRASGLARTARAGSFGCEGHGFSSRAHARAPIRTRPRRCRDSSRHPGGRQARVGIGSSGPAAAPAACGNPGRAVGPKAPATGAARHGRGVRRDRRREAARRKARRDEADAAATRGGRCFGGAAGCASRRTPRELQHWKGRPRRRGERRRRVQPRQERGGRQPAQPMITRIRLARWPQARDRPRKESPQGRTGDKGA